MYKNKQFARKANGKEGTPAPFTCRHIGPSMNPVLDEMDLLEIEPYGQQPIRPGDVIFFLPPGMTQPVVHRVARITDEGISTRGDNNGGNDPWLAAPKDVLGKATAAWRGQRKRSISGGRAGQLAGLVNRCSRALFQRASFLLGPAYRALAGSGIIRRGVPAFFKPQVLVFRSSNCTYYQLLAGRRVVGRYNHSRRRWDIKRPFKLFVDESSLPPDPSD